MTDKELIILANAARENSYSPYSHMAVGAALLTADGKVYSGCNVENAAYGVTNCAERTALFAAVAAGERRFTAIAIAGGKAGDAPAALFPPCGTCRQALSEFCSADLRIVLGTPEAPLVTTLGELLPMAFELEKGE